MSTKPVVAVAMSGGVDSSVAAALLVEQGYAVMGIMLRLWSEQDAARTNRCCTPDSVALARRVAASLSIPFYVLDAKQLFYDQVVLPFINDYAHNLTPNPCIACNRHVRWGYLYKYALSAGANYLATGHYARRIENPDHTYTLMQGVDPLKDQSYVLHVLTQEQLAHALFPLGGLHKSEVRSLAHKYNLPVAEKPDSQDLCFTGDGDYRQFLTRHAPGASTPGDILDVEGNLRGQHSGLAFYTIGQRKGLHIAAAEPLYVIEKNFEGNTIIVGMHDQSGCLHLHARGVNWIAGEPPAATFSAQVKIRYKAREIPATIEAAEPGQFSAHFTERVPDITPGQAAVLYNGEVCLGGGIITSQTE